MNAIQRMERVEWITEYIKHDSVTHAVDILNQPFVEKYIEKFNAPYLLQPFGAPTCRELGQILAFGYHCNIFNRDPISLTDHEVGFPNWVYAYTIKGR